MSHTKRILVLLLIVISVNLLGKSKESIILQFNSKANTTKILEYCSKYETEFKLKKDTLLALIAVESSFKNVDNKNSLGYVQMQMPTLLDLNKIYKVNKVTTKQQFKNSMENQIYYAALNLRYLIGKTGSDRGAFLAYNAGLYAYKKGRYVPAYYTKMIKYRTMFNNAK